MLHFTLYICYTHTNTHTHIYRLATGSSITLISPDPTVVQRKSGRDTVHNDSSTVTFLPNKENARKQNRVKGTVETISLSQRTIADEL